MLDSDRRGGAARGKGGDEAAEADTLICCLDPTLPRTHISGQM